MVPGHEIAGVVAAVGSGVTRYAVGDRVGRRLLRRLLPRVRELPGRPGAVLHRGGMRRHVQRRRPATASRPTAATRTQIVVDENYVLRIPDGIPLDVAAPLLCAGITLYSPLKHWGAGPGKKVADRRHGRPRPHGREDRARARRRGHRAQPVAAQEGGRPEAGRRPLLRHQRPETFEELAGTFDLIVNTVSADAGPGRLPGAAAGPTARWSNVGAPEEPVAARTCSR